MDTYITLAAVFLSALVLQFFVRVGLTYWAYGEIDGTAVLEDLSRLKGVTRLSLFHQWLVVDALVIAAMVTFNPANVNAVLDFLGPIALYEAALGFMVIVQATFVRYPSQAKGPGWDLVRRDYQELAK